MLSRQSTTCLDVFRCLKLAVSRLVPFGVWSLNRFVTRPFLHFSRLIVEGRTSLWGQTSGFLFRLAQCSQVTLQPYHWNLLCRKMLVNKNRFEILDRVLNDSLLHNTIIILGFLTVVRCIRCIMLGQQCWLHLSLFPLVQISCFNPLWHFPWPRTCSSQDSCPSC